jgi:hypothetical protein
MNDCTEQIGTKQLIADVIRADLLKKSSITQKPWLPKEETMLKSLIRVIEEQKLTITKADKGNATVIMTRDDYISKCQNFISSNHFEILAQDPTKLLQKQVKKALSTCSALLTDREKYFLSPMNPISPRFYGLPKLHKSDVPIRPIVSSVRAPAHKLALKLNTIFRELTNYSAKHAIKDSFMLTSRL